MPYSQIRVNKTKDIQEILAFLKKHYKALSESEIVKMALSKVYSMEMNLDLNYEKCETIVDFTDGGKKDGMEIDEVINKFEVADNK